MLAEIQNISRYFDQPVTGIRQTVLDGISLTIGNRESIAITGPSGSGKSTLLNILGLLDKPSSGRVVLDGVDTVYLDDKRLADLRNRFIGFVFQLHHLLPQLTLLENVLLPLLPIRDRSVRRQNLDRAHYLIERVGLGNHLSNIPARMSVGECQRAALVRALVNNPRLLLADEPTGSLDAENAAMLGALLSELNRDNDLTLVVVTHSTDLAARMQKNYRLSAGKLLDITVL
jgi:ABC-type lipoprotein export system ATPase subunit